MGNIFESGRDDFMFPTTRAGFFQTGQIFESADKKNKENEETDDDTISEAARASSRARAMSALLSWVEDGDYTYGALDETVIAVADLDGDFELSEEDEDEYNFIWAEMGDALLSLGVDLKDAQELVDGPGKDADDAAARIGAGLSKMLDEEEADDESLITGFAMGEDAILENVADDATLHGIMEATYKRRKVVRDGKVQIVRKRVSGKVRLSAAQKASLKKARRKANTSKAKLKRRKAMRIRQRRGL